MIVMVVRRAKDIKFREIYQRFKLGADDVMIMMLVMMVMRRRIDEDCDSNKSKKAKFIFPFVGTI